MASIIRSIILGCGFMRCRQRRQALLFRCFSLSFSNSSMIWRTRFPLITEIVDEELQRWRVFQHDRPPHQPLDPFTMLSQQCNAPFCWLAFPRILTNTIAECDPETSTSLTVIRRLAHLELWRMTSPISA